MKKMGTMNIVLIFVGIFLIAFTSICLILFYKLGHIPDTLVTCVFTACTGELGVMGWIRSTKQKYQDREWQLEDKKQEANSVNIEPEKGEEREIIR